MAQALTAFRRAIRAHRRLAKLAPHFFDSAVVDCDAHNRAERRRWRAFWEPWVARAYGVEPKPPDPEDEVPPLPPPHIQQAVDRELAGHRFWMEAGRVAMDRHQQRHPHALMSFSRMARWLDLALDFQKMALGLDSKNPPPMRISYDYTFADLKRSYPDPGETVGAGEDSGEPVTPSTAPSPPAEPPDDKRDLIPHKLVVGPHGLLCLQRLKEGEKP